MEQKTITPKERKAMEKVKRANAEFVKVRREQKKRPPLFMKTSGMT